MSCDLFIFAGEKSGDLHGEKLLKALHTASPSLKISGVAGPRMRAEGIDCVLATEEFQVMGFVDVFLALPKLTRQFYFIADAILKSQPRAVLFIDYPGFNLRMARHLRKKGYTGKLIHFICPSVWAWGEKRIPLMAQNLDLLFSILPFEKSYFAHTHLQVEFVGHPLVQRLKEHEYKELPLRVGKRLLSLFPGSREKEIRRNLPQYLRICQQLKKRHADLDFALSLSEEKFRPLIEEMIRQHPIGAKITLVPIDATYELMKASHAAIAKSGTVTLELALHQIPTVVTYAISPLDLIIARDLLRIRLPHYCLVNIIGRKEIFPELFGPNFTEEALSLQIERMISDSSCRNRCQEACAELAASFQDKDPCREIARYISEKITMV